MPMNRGVNQQPKVRRPKDARREYTETSMFPKHCNPKTP